MLNPGTIGEEKKIQPAPGLTDVWGSSPTGFAFVSPAVIKMQPLRGRKIFYIIFPAIMHLHMSPLAGHLTPVTINRMPQTIIHTLHARPRETRNPKRGTQNSGAISVEIYDIRE